MANNPGNNWISSIFPDKKFIIKRREERHHVSDIYQKYADFKVKVGTAYESATLLNFSSHGIMFQAPVSLDKGARTNCIISIRRSLSKNIEFEIAIKHCKKLNGIYLIGAAIEIIADETWFNILLEVRDYILKREDKVF